MEFTPPTTTLEARVASRRRKFVTPWKKATQEGDNDDDGGSSSNAAAPFAQPPRMTLSPSISPAAMQDGSRSRAEERLARLTASAAARGSYTRWIQCSREGKRQEKEVSFPVNAIFQKLGQD
uniref:Uncharacterized protein n=1 Tax=Leersia perrieri TaxID=77586 RepID=A0A0D9XU93_9ORYZ